VKVRERDRQIGEGISLSLSLSLSLTHTLTVTVTSFTAEGDTPFMASWHTAQQRVAAKRAVREG
jgi:hypothetical protein